MPTKARVDLGAGAGRAGARARRHGSGHRRGTRGRPRRPRSRRPTAARSRILTFVGRPRSNRQIVEWSTPAAAPTTRRLNPAPTRARRTSAASRVMWSVHPSTTAVPGRSLVGIVRNGRTEALHRAFTAHGGTTLWAVEHQRSTGAAAPTAGGALAARSLPADPHASAALGTDTSTRPSSGHLLALARQGRFEP